MASGKSALNHPLSSQIYQNFSVEELNLFRKFLNFVSITGKLVSDKSAIPMSIFSTGKLSVQEAIIKYLRENLSFSYKQIAEALNKNPGPIGISYRTAKRKHPSALPVSFEQGFISLSIFINCNSVFATCVKYLIENERFKIKQVASLLKRHYTTIWTVYNRVKKKHG